MTHGSLFSGGGGFDLAAEWMGWENKFHCEWNPFCQKILKYYWPNAQSYSDITKTDFSVWRGRIDIISGGFPCQPFSQAGKQEGTNDSRYLWPEMLRVIREVRPTYVVGENVYGLVNWSGGLVFDKVQTDLENEGFKVIPIVLPAAAVNAPHRRDRIWFVAFSKSSRANRGENREDAEKWTTPNSDNSGTNITMRSEREWKENNINGGFSQSELRQNDGNGDAADSDGARFKAEREQPIATTQKRIGNSCSGWERFPTQSPVCNGDDGIPSRLDSITFPKWRNESIKAGGNAIVPQVALQIFKSLVTIHNQ